MSIIKYLKKYKNQTGLSLIETMVAFSILAVAFITLVQAFPYGLSITKEVENKTIASYLAQLKIEELYSLGYGNISTGTLEDVDNLSADQLSYLYSYGRKTEVYYVDENLDTSVSDIGMKKIIVTAYYRGGFWGQTKSFNISTLIAEN